MFIFRRYARTDEIAIPFGITIDFETVKNSTVTLRERDSTLQVRLPVRDTLKLLHFRVHLINSFSHSQIDKAGRTVHDLAMGLETWESVMNTFPKFESQDVN